MAPAMAARRAWPPGAWRHGPGRAAGGPDGNGDSWRNRVRHAGPGHDHADQGGNLYCRCYLDGDPKRYAIAGSERHAIARFERHAGAERDSVGDFYCIVHHNAHGRRDGVAYANLERYRNHDGAAYTLSLIHI